jgi:hypothetical protein
MIDGGYVGDLPIADYRREARRLRTRAFVAVALPTDRRARSASDPPHLSSIWKRGVPSIEHLGKKSGGRWIGPS